MDKRDMVKVMKVAVVDDEADILREYRSMFARLSRETEIEFSLFFFSDGMDLVSDYKSGYDMIFMDIDMPKLNGLETAKQLRKMDENVMLVFVTRLAKYAINGYKYDAFDFVLKPLDYATFRMKMRRALGVLSRRRPKCVCVRSEGMSRIIPCDRIIYVEAMGHDIIYHTTDGDITTYGTLSEAGKALGNDDFVMCSRCYLVNAAFVTDIGVDTVRLRAGGAELPVSRMRKRPFLAFMTEWLGKNV